MIINITIEYQFATRNSSCELFDPQMELGQIAIADIKLDPKSRNC